MPTSRDWWASPFGMPTSMQDGAEVSRGKFDIYAGVTVDHCPRDFFLTTSGGSASWVRIQRPVGTYRVGSDRGSAIRYALSSES